ncbi:hypothetical protein Tco_1388460 [Tanacetum coccineum]
MDVRVPPAMSSGLFASMAEVAAMTESVFCKRFRSFYDSSPSSSPPDLPLRKHYRGTSELVEDSEEDDDEEDEEIEESLDSDSVSEDAEDEGPTAEDEDPVAGDEGLTARFKGPSMDDKSHGMEDESHGMDDESHGLDDESRGLDDEGHSVKSDGFGLEEEEEAVPRGQQQAAPVVGTAVSAPLGLGYGALRHRELALEEDHVYTTFEVRQGSGSAPESERPDRVSASRQPTLTIWTDPEDSMVYIYVPTYPPPAPPVQTPLSPEWTSAGSSSRDAGGLIRDHVVRLEELLPALFERLVLALESWAGQSNAQRAALWYAISDMQGENRDLLLQLAEERRWRLKLAEVVDKMRRGQEPRGDA